jgi:hypothetical protein
MQPFLWPHIQGIEYQMSIVRDVPCVNIARARTRIPAPVAHEKTGHAGRVPLAYVEFDDDPSRRGLVSRLSSADAKGVAQTIARALTGEARNCIEE